MQVLGTLRSTVMMGKHTGKVEAGALQSRETGFSGCGRANRMVGSRPGSLSEQVTILGAISLTLILTLVLSSLRYFTSRSHSVFLLGPGAGLEVVAGKIWPDQKAGAGARSARELPGSCAGY